jgi:hypothetical protein
MSDIQPSPKSVGDLIARACAAALYRDLYRINQDTARLMGPLPQRGIPTQAKRKPRSTMPPSQYVPQSQQTSQEAESMDIKTVVAALTLAAITPACKSSTSPAIPEVSISTNAASQKPLPLSVEEKLKEGMPYQQLRAIVLSDGWKPVVDPECKAQVIGGDFEERCKNGRDARCNVCAELPELSACGAGGLCMLVFEASSGEKLNVTGIGNVTTWNKAPPQLEFYVQAWSFENGQGR